MTVKSNDMSLVEMGEELVRLGTMLKNWRDTDPQTTESSASLSRKPQEPSARSKRKKVMRDFSAFAEELKVATRSSAEQRLTELTTDELLALGKQLSIRLDSKAPKQELRSRLLWMLFDSERGGELLRTLHQRESEKDDGGMFERDVEWFHEHRKELGPQYDGQYVAVRNGTVVDHDATFGALAERIYAEYGYRDLVMQKVEANPRPHRIVSPRVVRG